MLDSQAAAAAPAGFWCLFCSQKYTSTSASAVGVSLWSFVCRRRAVSVDFTLMQLETCLQPHGQLGLAAAGTSGRKGMRERRRGRDGVLLSHMIRDMQEDGQAGEARADAVSYEHVTAA